MIVRYIDQAYHGRSWNDPGEAHDGLAEDNLRPQLYVHIGSGGVA